MPRLPIIENASNDTDSLPASLLPVFYMEDFSILGLRVGNLEAAVQLLQKNGIGVRKDRTFRELVFERRDQLPFLVRLLNANDISCTIADIPEQIYQG